MRNDGDLLPILAEQLNPRWPELLAGHGYSVLDEAVDPSISGICIRGEVAECYMAWTGEDPRWFSRTWQWIWQCSKALYNPCGTDTKVSRVVNDA